MKQPELLSPAGTLKNMRYAFAYGADAVYAGQPRYSLRVRNNDFNKLDALAQGIAEAHALGKKFYLASNLLAHNAKLKTYMRDLEPVVAMQPDALIMADPGLIMWVRERWPDLELHLSVQANVVNYAAVQFWQQVGIRRVILSRELSLEEVAEIREACPDMELEVFVHGALCIAYSGRCLLSGYMNHRDANQGTCTNACRWPYGIKPAVETAGGDVQICQPDADSPAPQLGEGATTDSVFLLEEPQRPGEYMPIYEDEHGTYIMNSKDLRAVQHIQRLIEMGIDCVKIEGRTKSHYYVARTAQVYRRAIDDALHGRSFNPTLLQELEKLASRGYTEGFFRRHVHDEYQNYQQGNSISTQQVFVGEVTGQDAATGLVNIEVKNRFEQGDQLEMMLPQGNHAFTLSCLEDKHGQPLQVAPGSGHQVRIKVPLDADFSTGLLLKNLSSSLMVANA